MITARNLRFMGDVRDICEERLKDLKRNPFKWYNPLYWKHIKSLQNNLYIANNVLNNEDAKITNFPKILIQQIPSSM